MPISMATIRERKVLKIAFECKPEFSEFTSLLCRRRRRRLFLTELPFLTAVSCFNVFQLTK